MALILAGAASGGGYWYWHEKAAPKAAQAPPPPVPVPVVAVAVRTIPVVRQYVAVTRSPNTVDVRARATGYLRHRHFKEGADVRAGDVLYQIDARDYQAKLAQSRRRRTPTRRRWASPGRRRRATPRWRATSSARCKWRSRRRRPRPRPKRRWNNRAPRCRRTR